MSLTKRQTQIVELLAQGLTAEQVATAMHRSAGTVKRHILLACERVGAKNTTHLTALSISRNWIKPLCLALAFFVAGDLSDHAIRRPTARVRLVRPTTTRMYA